MDNMQMKYKNGFSSDMSCKDCQNTLGFAPELALGMAYVPDQEWTHLYDTDCALRHGTIFKQLDKPFLGWRCQ